jgi:5-methylcytosine-specific restriction protein B
MKFLGNLYASSFLNLANDKSLAKVISEETKQSLHSIFCELKKVGAEFGYRSASEIVRFCSVIRMLEPGISDLTALDFAIMQKLLPKLHGSRRKLEPAIKMLGNLCINFSNQPGAEIKIEDLLTGKVEFSDTVSLQMPCSFEKLSRMYKGLLDSGFSSYAEA